MGAAESCSVLTGPVARVGGTVAYVRGLAHYSRYRPVLLHYSSLSAFSPRYRGLPYFLLRHPMLARLDPYSSFLRLVRVRRFDILHTHGHPVWRGLYSWRTPDGPRTIHTVHQVYRPDDLVSAGRWPTFDALNSLMISYCRSADLVVTVSDYGRRMLRDEFGIEAEVVRPAVDSSEIGAASPARARATWGMTEDFVLFAGGDSPQKGLGTALSIARELGHRQFVFVGSGTDNHVASARGPFPRNVRGLGLLSRRDFMDCLAACQVLLVPSRREMMSTLILEGMALCKPVVASRIPSSSEIIQDGETGYLFEPDNLGELRDKCEKAWSDHRVGGRAATLVRENHTWSIRAVRADELYDRVLEDRG